MRNNSYNDDRYDRRSRRGQDRFESDYRTRNDWDDNRSSYFGGRDRMDMDEDRDGYGERYGYRNNSMGRGWSDSDRSTSGNRWNDDYRYSSRMNGNRYDDDDDNFSRRSSEYGRYGSTGRGWFGDYEGHSDAAERGWDNRRSERGSDSRDRYREDDDRRSGSGRGRGWFGESSRHSSASERGWDNRR